MECIGTGYVDCQKEAKYVRHTQFAGSHPLCAEHAMEDDKFLLNDSYTVWEYIEND